MTSPGVPWVAAVADSPSKVLLRTVSPQRSVQQIRALLMTGYGPGARQATVDALTRDRKSIAGRRVSQLLDDVANHTAKARGEGSRVLAKLVRIGRRLLITASVVFLVGYAVKRTTARPAPVVSPALLARVMMHSTAGSDGPNTRA